MKMYQGKSLQLVEAGGWSFAGNAAAIAAAVLVVGFMEWAFSINW